MGRLKDFFFGKDDVDKKTLEEQQATAVANSNRSIWSGGIVRGLNPERLAVILDSVRNGEAPAEYLDIAQEIEERDAHYRSVLSTRKHAVEGLEMCVKAASDNADDIAVSEAVQQDILNHPDIMDLRKNALDALGKGFSVNEIVWDTSGDRWRPAEFIFCDPRWFAYARDTGELSLRSPIGCDLEPLKPYQFIIHEPNLLSGKQITSGLSFTAIFYWLIKHYDVTSWASFVDRFGYPVRLGKYGKKATKDDIATLKRAISSIGTDVGAVIPDSMMIDIVESKTTGTNADVYEKHAEWVDKQLSKLVLGQTASAEGTPGKLGDSQSQEEVRQDILKADAAQLEQTLNRDLVIPYVNFNFGPQKVYPRLCIKYVEAKNVQLIVESVKAMVPFGLRVKKNEINNLLGLSIPDDKDEVLEPPPASAGTGLNAAGIALNAQSVSIPDSVKTEEELLDDAAASDFVEISDEIANTLEAAAARSSSFAEYKNELEKLVTGWQPDKVAELMAVAFFKARSAGDTHFEGSDN
jgi:phage gp29-like protein